VVTQPTKPPQTKTPGGPPPGRGAGFRAICSPFSDLGEADKRGQVRGGASGPKKKKPKFQHKQAREKKAETPAHRSKPNHFVHLSWKMIQVNAPFFSTSPKTRERLLSVGQSFGNFKHANAPSSNKRTD